MRKSLLLIFILITSTKSIYSQAFENEIKAFEHADSISFPALDANLFVGSSSFRLWKSINQDFEKYKIINRGFGGSNLVDLEAFIPRIVTKYSPKKIFIYSGENDIAGGANATETLMRFTKVFEKIRAIQPQVAIAFVSIKPSIARQGQFEIQKEANMLIKKYLKEQTNAEYINIVNKMLLKGNPNPSIFIGDGLHMNQKGYEIWAKKLRKYLTKN